MFNLFPYSNLSLTDRSPGIPETMNNPLEPVQRIGDGTKGMDILFLLLSWVISEEASSKTLVLKILRHGPWIIHKSFTIK